MTADAIQAWLIARLAHELQLAPKDIDVREPFASYGLDSVRAVSLSGDLEEWLGRRLSPTLAYEYPTVESLARFLEGEASESAPEADVYAAASEDGGEPVAIVGIGCRFPGAENPEAFWRLLRDGIDAVSEVPADRWDAAALFDPDPAVPGKMNTRWGGFLPRVDLFDPYAFGISPREAARMDPQQRLLLEVTWEALDDAGLPPSRVGGSRTGVFIGISSNDYGQLQLADPALADPHAGTGNALSIAANRLSYLLDLHGPSLAVDTACSSSLVAVHLACRSLRTGECRVAIAGGVNVILSPSITINFTKAGFMAPDGRCKAFDARADGYVRGEGAGVVILKPLPAAQADGDRIYAVIRGSAVNSDGRTNGLTAPNMHAQIAVLREAYRQAGVAPGRVGFVECHGTGTALGDRIEAQALGSVLAEGRPSSQPCAIGSVKTNVGHLEAAAGAAGLIKVAMALAHREIPPSLHFVTPNPYVSFDTLRLRVQQRREPLPSTGSPVIAGVSSFGFGGTNAHVVLEESPLGVARAGRGGSRVSLLPLSAHSPDALRAQALACADVLSDDVPADGPAVSLVDLCYTASVRRDHRRYRLAVVGDSKDALAARLRTLVQDGGSSTSPAADTIPLVAFVFSGQGPQWWGMGRELLATEPAFRAAVSEADRLLRAYVDWSLLEEFTTDEAHSRLDQTDIAQPAIFALHVGLLALWRSWGIEPDAVVGHSMGEVAAAYAAGVLTLPEAVRVIAHRGRLTHRAAGLGKMAAVELPIGDARDAIAAFSDRLWVAAVNSPTSTTIAGDPAALESVLASLRQRNILCRVLRMDYAFHTPQMEPHDKEVADALAGLATTHPTSRLLVSTVTGREAAAGDFGADYWRRNVRAPVQFAAAIETLLHRGYRVFVEIGPHPVLGGAVFQCLRASSQDGTVLPSLRRTDPERSTLLSTLASLYGLGRPVAWSGLYPEGARVVTLPTYRWQRERLWRGPSGTPAWGALHAVYPSLHDAPARAVDNDWRRLLYEITWESQDTAGPVGPAPPTGPADPWLVLSDRDGLGQAFATGLEAAGHPVVQVTHDTTPGIIDRSHAAVHAGDALGLERLVQERFGRDRPSCAGVVHLWSLDADLQSGVSLTAAQALACASIVQLIQSLSRVRWERAPRVWVVTRGAQRVAQEDTTLAPAGGLAWGMGRTIAAEHRALWGGLVDVARSTPPTDAVAHLWAAILDPRGEDQLAFRDGRRYAARLRRWDGAGGESHGIAWRTDASYLITGGLGDLGLDVARWMVGQGARRVILLGRTPLPPRATWRATPAGTREGRRIAAVREIEALGASVQTAHVDVADEGQLRAFLDAFRQEAWPPIRGVVHAAGVAQLRTVLEQDDAALHAVLDPKVRGAWWLHALLSDMDLDFCVYFSSLSAVLGSPRLGAYAAANAFLDTLAHARRAQGRPALSVNWGMWGDTGMAARERPSAQAAPRGTATLGTREALDALGWLLGTDRAQAGVFRFDWAAWQQFAPDAARTPYLRAVYGDTPMAVATPQRPATSGIDLQILRGGDPAERTRLVEDFLREQVAAVLQIPAKRLDVHRPLTSLGLDSMMAVQLKNQIETTVGLEVNLVQLLEGPSIAQVARALSDDLAGEPAAMVHAPAVSQRAEDDRPANLDHLSDEEVDSLLLRLSGHGGDTV